MKKIIVITSSISQPRVIKRILSLFEAGFDIKVYGYDRNVYNCNELPEAIDVVNLGSMRDGTDYISKLRQFKDSTYKIVQLEGRQDTVYYSFSVLSAFFLMCQGVKYVYELSDLLYGYPRFDAIRPICKFLDRHIINRSSLTVMTSDGFREYLFGNELPQNVHIQHNKLSAYFTNIDRPAPKYIDIAHLKFAFIGAIRYKDTILRFAKVIGRKFPQHQFHFFGDSVCVKEFEQSVSEFNNIFFHGAFRNPQDLYAIYSQIDIVVACYETESLNERIAEPNKLYEATYFCKPIIVSENSFLQKQVQRFHCGYVIDAYSDEQIESFIGNLTSESISQVQLSASNITEDKLIDNPNRLIEYLFAIH